MLKNIKKWAKSLQCKEKALPLHHQNKTTSRSGAGVARWAHNPKVIGSNPFSATKEAQQSLSLYFFLYKSDN